MRKVLIEEPLAELSADVTDAFAWDEVACRKTGKGEFPALARIWRHPRAIVLGLRDRRLPYAGTAMEKLRGDGFSVGVRNSGGAAVPLDSGVVNLSLILPYEQGTRMDFHREFRLMANLIADAVKPWSKEVRWGEIRGSFCPGEYDLALSGRKFCGIAQRRQLRACVVSAFVIVEGSGEERGQVAQRFYREATGGVSHADDPMVVPASMASLQELAGVPSAEAFLGSLRELLDGRGDTGKTEAAAFSGIEFSEILSMRNELKRRYDHD
ncbi:lipoyl protein ligase domain-containing protein [Paenibacillus sp. YN15]|uniref:lipoate--protein ligase family protein n=1 Tax=Paenibacillus sp. YN15 TaxID=1742774 RepID=UPI000DCBF731|nr:lipoate--protein ligase family protein [Paenibacillus sp. YN15]RAV00929.1 lipoate--protein ligase family protein [Paenibacillus sp. YN15]